jgi:hypothetical protein
MNYHKKEMRSGLHLATYLIMLMACHAALPDIPEDSKGAILWRDQCLSRIQELDAQSNEKTQELGEMLRQIKTLGYRESREKDEIVSELEKRLVSTPGHAIFYQRKIDSLREEVLANAGKPEDEINQMRVDGTLIDFGTYEKFQREAFAVMGLMRSSETVAVLGYFLNDPEGRNGKTLLGDAIYLGEGRKLAVNAEEATKAIRQLAIENPPFQTAGAQDYYYVREGEIDAWKSWWNDVKDGKRTYRFIGSGVEYGPAGPVSGGKAHQSRTDRKGNSAVSSQEDHSRMAMIMVGILVACCLCVAAVWYYLKSARTRSP